MATKKEKEFLIRVRADIKQAVGELKKMSGHTARTARDMEKQAKGAQLAGRAIRYLGAATAVYLSLRTAKQLLLIADRYQALQTRIKTATKATGDYTKVSRELSAISKETGASLLDSVEIFQRVARAAPELGATTDEVLALTRSVQQLGIISGASGVAMKMGLLQLGQGLTAGVFRAEEFNSILENLPEVASRIAKGMGLTVGQLRRLVIEGKLLSIDVFESLKKQSAEINADFKEVALTIERASNSTANSFQRFLGVLDKAADGTSRLAKVIQGIGDSLDNWAELIGADELDDAMRRRAGLMIEYQRQLHLGIDKESEVMRRFIKHIDILDEKIKKLNKAKLDVETSKTKPNKKIDLIDQTALKEQQRLLKEGARVFQQTRTAAEEYAVTVAWLEELFQSSAIGLDTYTRAMEAAKKKLEDLGDKGKSTFAELEGAIRGWGDEFTDTMTDMVMSGKLDFQGLAESIIRDLLRIMIQIKIMEPLFNGIFGFISPGKPAPFPTRHASGGVFGPSGSVPLHTYASGGIATRPQLALFGEGDKPEAFVPLPDGRRIPVSLQGQGAGPVQVEIVNQGQPIEAESAEARVDPQGMVVSIITRDLRSGGPISSKLGQTFGIKRKPS